MYEVKFKKMRESAKVPHYATEGAAAVDLCAAIDEPITLAPAERRLIPTGIAISPESRDVVAVIAGRSGLGIKKGVTLSNAIGVIDSDYRGEIAVGLINHGSEPFEVKRGDRIAQMMFMPIYAANFIPVDDLDQTSRGAGGFGSTGKA